VRASVLERVVEHERVRPARRGARRAAHPVRIRQHRNVRVEQRVHARLVAPDASDEQRRSRAAAQQLGARPGGHGRLARPPDGEVADAECRKPERVRAQDRRVVHRRAGRRTEAEQELGRRERGARRGGPDAAPVPHPLREPRGVHGA
jgi:hypothetical protein